MRKNKIDSKTIKSFSLGKLTSRVYTTYQITGSNPVVLINKLARRGILVKNAKKVSQNTFIVSIFLNDNKKFFALAKELCYNVKKIKNGGIAYPLVFVFKNWGIAVGTALFLFLSTFFSDFVLGFSFCGEGSVYSQSVERYLADKGIGIYSRFSCIDLQKLQNQILADNDYLSFASCKKRGNKLVIELQPKNAERKVLDNSVKNLYSTAKGVVEEIKVYSGTPVVNVGSTVAVGDLLVGGFDTVREERVEINVLATVKIRVADSVLIYLPQDNAEDYAVAFAENSFTDKSVCVSSVEKSFNGENYIYKVNFKYLCFVKAG